MDIADDALIKTFELLGDLCIGAGIFIFLQLVVFIVIVVFFIRQLAFVMIGGYL